MRSYQILLVIFFLITNVSLSQTQNLFWESINTQQVTKDSLVFYKSIPVDHSFYKLDVKGLQDYLMDAPQRAKSQISSKIVEFPTANGNFQSFRIMKASVMAPELQQQFPTTFSYIGQGIEDPSMILRFSMSQEKGLSSMILSSGKTQFIEPYTTSSYISFTNSKQDKTESSFECLTESIPSKTLIHDLGVEDLKNANDGQLRTYRLALSCTVEYAQFHGGTLEGVIAAMNTTMTRVNAIYERDLGVTMVMVPNESIIFLGPDINSDPFTNGSGGAMLSQNQEVCDNNIGFSNYDIGHVFSTGGGGIALLNSPCTNSKAGGVTGQPAPVGDVFDVDYVAHEMGHQYGANHTQNNDCNRSAVSVEPGSASTIMGYAGICAPNVQSNSDDYFHGESIKEMWFNISQGNSSSCPQISSPANTAPIADAGPDYFIPKSTPFVLKGNASDADANDLLTYTWEQIDRTPAPMPPQSSSSVGPAFRSVTPSVSPDRFMPTFSTVLSGSLASTWEVVPSVARAMSFLLTVRDNSILVGNTSSDEMQVTTIETTPFTVQTPPNWAPGSTQVVNWNVGDTNLAPINCETVTIYFSENGVDFSTVLAAGVPNNGSAEVSVPNLGETSTARVLVEADDHIFYAVSEPFNLTSAPDYNVNPVTLDRNICNEDTAEYEFNISTTNGFSETVTFSAVGPENAVYNFTPSSVNQDSSFNLEVSNLLDVLPGNYSIEVVATSANLSRSTEVELNISDGACTSIANTNFDTSTTGVILSDGETEILTNLNTGKPSGYSDYTDIITDVIVNETYELTVNAESDGDYQVITYVWIDWSQNCSFDDPGEQYDLGTSFSVSNEPTSNSPLAITVPDEAALGNTRMRITTKYTPAGQNDFPLPCENGHDAEVEDYTIHVESTLGGIDFAFQDLSIYPNPSQGFVSIKYHTTKSMSVSIKLYDLRGKSIMSKSFEAYGRMNQKLDLSGLQSGIYLLKLNDGNTTTTKKLIVE